MRVPIQTLVEAYINSEYGWSVAEQFRDTWNGESFEGQNYNALTYIKGSVEALISSDVLSADAKEELIEYRVHLAVYLSK
jgi:hypothetical protein